MNISFSIKKYILPFLISIGATLVLSGIVCLVFPLINPPYAVSAFISRHIYCLCAVISAFVSARLSGKNGMITGAVSASINTLILIFAGMLILKNPFPVESLPRLLLISTVSGAVFGVVGLNFKK